MPEQPKWLVELAERKLGAGALIGLSRTGWTATHGLVKVTGRTRDVLAWFLEQMPDKVTDG